MLLTKDLLRIAWNSPRKKEKEIFQYCFNFIFIMGILGKTLSQVKWKKKKH